MTISIETKKELLVAMFKHIEHINGRITVAKYCLKSPKQFTNEKIDNKRKNYLIGLLQELEQYTKWTYEVQLEIECLETTETLKAMGTPFRNNGRIFYLLP